MKISELPSSSKPREKALRQGLNQCSDAELLSIVIGNGIVGHSALEIGQEILHCYNGLSNVGKATLEELKTFDGISQIRALILSTVFEIAKRFSIEEENKKSETPYSLFLKHKFLSGKDNEELYVICFDKRKRIKRERLLYKGTESKLPIEANRILSEAIKDNSNSLAIIHNHPSGDCKPSQSDVIATLEISQKCKALGVELFDHIIVGDNAYFSFLESGMLSDIAICKDC